MFEKYKLNLSKEKRKELGFRYDFDLEDYVYEFPAYKSNGITSLKCKLSVDDETCKILVNVYDMKGNIYSSFYNRRYGKSKIVSIVDRNIKNKIEELKKMEENASE